MRTVTAVMTNGTGWLRVGATLALSGLLAACGGAATQEPIEGQIGAETAEAIVPTEATPEQPIPTIEATVEVEMETPVVSDSETITDTGEITDTDPMTDTNTAGEIGDLPPESSQLTVSDIMQDPAQYVGQQITVVGEAQRIFGSSAFKLDEDSFLTAGVDNDLVVVSAEQENPAAETTWLNNQVMVTGTLQLYVQAEFERDFDWFQPGVEWEGEIEESQPYLIAESVTRLEEGVFDPGLGSGTGELEGAPAGTLTVAEVTGDLAEYEGQTVTVQGEVQEVYASGALRLDEDALLMGGIDNDMIVVGSSLGDASLNEDGWLDSIVRVTGTVRPFDRGELEGELGITLDDPVFDTWEGNPVLMAESVEQVR